MSLRLLLSTARHVDPAQLAARVAKRVRHAWWRVSKATIELPASVSYAPRALPCASGDATRGAAIADGRFTFLGREIVYRGEPVWHDDEVPRSWRFHLNSFDYVADLIALARAGERERARATFRALADSWIERNARLTGDPWDAFTVSLRVPNWLCALAEFPEESDRVARSIYAQTGWILRNLENDIRGNHLIKNLRGVILGAASFEGDEPRRWIASALARLRKELTVQILPDGGHFERNPGYHVVVIRDLEDIASVLDQTPPWLTETIARMRTFHAAIAQPDGKLPLLKDTTYDEEGSGLRAQGSGDSRDEALSPEPRALSPKLLEPSGFLIVRRAGAYTIADFGPPCPDTLPAHAHADALSFELFANGRRTVVDSGVYEYAAGEWRDYFRSTRAHNTVVVNGRNQSEVWSSFRVGRRARVRLVEFKETADAVTLVAEHDGYAPIVHRRTFVWRGGSLTVTDDITGPGEASCESYLHLHPDVDSIPIEIFGFDAEEVTTGWYSERFGEKRTNRVHLFRKKGTLPLRFGYTITTGV